MFENTIRRMPRPQDVPRLNTQELRDTFHITNLFTPDELRGTFTDLDRLVVGGIMPVKPVELTNHKETGRAFFLERRELGAINVGGAGAVHADGKTFSLDRLDCVYLPMGTRSVTFESQDVKNPAKFYFLSCPAHKAHPAAMMKPKDASPVALGAAGVGKQTDDLQIHPPGRHSELPARDGVHRAGGGERVEYVPAAHALAAHGDLFLFRPRRKRADAFLGRTPADAPPFFAQRRGRAVAELVHPLRLRHGQLQIHLGHGRRKPDVGALRRGKREEGVQGNPAEGEVRRRWRQRGRKSRWRWNLTGRKSRKFYDRVLVAVGRAPNSADIGLENTNVTLDEKGFVKVNDRQQTDDPNIYAIGDIAGGILLAQKAAGGGANRRRKHPWRGRGF